MELVQLTINGKVVEVQPGATILEAAKKLNIEIPTLCHLRLQDGEHVSCTSSCRVCVVEVDGRKNLAAACSTPVSPYMSVKTNTQKVANARKTIVELLLSDHPQDCLKCQKNLKCELQKIASDLNIRDIRYEGEMNRVPTDYSSVAITRDVDKCILCRRCVSVCNNIQTVNVLSPVSRGFDTIMSTAFLEPLADTNCTNCGQCVAVCPTGALREANDEDRVWDALDDEDKYVIVQTAPAIRTSLGEQFGFKPGTNVTGKMVSALKALGFKKVYDTDFAADLTIMEEATELINRIKENKNLPLLTSCCPGWIKFLEHNYGDFLNLPSSCKSPQQMFGAIAKSYLAEKIGVDPKNMIVVSVMPCTAKKFEASREELEVNGIRDVDIVITTRELSSMIKSAGLDLKEFEDEDFDNPLGESSGAGVIFGNTGGVMEAALRTAHEWVTGETLENIEFKAVRGFVGIKSAKVKIGDLELKVAVASSLGNARKLMEAIKDGSNEYSMIEVMACPFGCIDGGGQPFIRGNRDILRKRAEVLYSEDLDKKIRKSHENPMIKKVYKNYLIKPNSEKAHELLHTHYISR
ncbi:NADH-dependent [FeFe] hydrogenase, group A6 [Clostridium sp. 'White wine YQ']|uniref:NADH-dependent [FeFe] hydrogenase, group A6 n=1 Tax=Clostridium sp. 'White wine YQ' TaxID=3027474 RepID=UPI0023671115|nr:NADH-dependent [FeFe] hydrogenase, group A6 [Clostridium sp. 'White wine YQ']MDD7792975.1 NADH-dependent [FeFe] hydrogenase, group A6 [Clostridium sp. 'White wine YQ']